ncbi:MAG: hypothetical protein U1E45_18305 [Geminicoccaceae bacterium]
MAAEARLLEALDGLDRNLEVWWRDDDAGRPSSRLARLRSIAAERVIAVGLAVVPAWLEPSVIGDLSEDPNVAILQHGWAHENHARAGDKKIELGGVADLGALTDRLGAGFRVLDDRFGHKFLRVLVPPWNRISAEITPLLGDLGFVGLSTFGKEQPSADPRVRWVNTHLDLVHWGANPIPLTFDESVTRLTDLLLNRRLWRIGLLTHHLVMDDAAFLALDRLLGLLLDHPRVVWRAPHELFGMPP